jgi:alpha-tubulin suppressor-like RCC1 family protein
MHHASASQYKTCSCSENHCIGLTNDGRAFTWALTSRGNKFGQLCASSAPSSPLQSTNIGERREVDIGQRVVAVGAGGSQSTGHTALVGEDGTLFMCGCDRWQQLGLSSQKGGVGGNAAGYTWDGGKIWQSSPQKLAALKGIKIIKVTQLTFLKCLC